MPVNHRGQKPHGRHGIARLGGHRQVGIEEPLGRHARQAVELVVPDLQLGQVLLGDLTGVWGGLGPQARPTLHHCGVEESGSIRHGQKGGNLRSAARLAENHDPVRIAPEGLNVVAHPFERQHQVQHAGVARPRVSRPTDLVEVQVPEGRQSMVHSDHHHIAPPGQVGAVVPVPGARTRPIAAAVDAEQNGAAAAIGDTRRPHVENQAVLALTVVRRVAESEQIHDWRTGSARDTPHHLRRRRPKGGGGPDPRPGGRRRWWAEAVLAPRWRAIRNALEHPDAAVFDTAHLAISRFCDGLNHIRTPCLIGVLATNRKLSHAGAVRCLGTS